MTEASMLRSRPQPAADTNSTPSLADRLNNLRHHHVDLSDGRRHTYGNHPSRPELTVWAALSEDFGPTVVLQIGALFGQNARFADLIPSEARHIAAVLIATAAAVERESGVAS